jgi:hypothetical protein
VDETYFATRRLKGKQNTKVSASYEKENGAAEKPVLRSVLLVNSQMLPVD